MGFGLWPPATCPRVVGPRQIPFFYMAQLGPLHIFEIFHFKGGNDSLRKRFGKLLLESFPVKIKHMDRQRLATTFPTTVI